MTVWRYPVNKQWAAGLPNLPYRNGVGAYEGVVMHFTDNYNSTASGEADWMAQNWKNAFVHEFIDATQVIQTADPQYKAYGAGPNANPRFVHLELCVSKTAEEFATAFDAWCERAAEHLLARRLGVVPAQADGSGTLWRHSDVTKILGGTTHQDPDDYLAKWGKSWQDVIDKVSSYYNSLYNDLYAPKPAPTPQPAPAPVVVEQPKVQTSPSDAVPDWAKPTIDKLVNKGLLTDPSGDNTFYRVLVVLDRAGVFGK